MQHKFPEGFKPINIEQYDGTTDPAIWIEDFLMHVHMAGGDDLHAIKYLSLKLKGSARHWLNSLPNIQLEYGKTSRMPSEQISKALTSDPRMPTTLPMSCKS